MSKLVLRKEMLFLAFFVRDHRDYTDLKSKNFWRIVPRSQFDAYSNSKNVGLAKIFHGGEFSRLTLHTAGFESV